MVRIFLLSVLGLVLTVHTQLVDAQRSFENYYDLVYQIRVVSPQAGSKSSIGSGFQVSEDGLIITNYHVVSSFVQSPESHEIEYLAHSGKKGTLTLLDFDVVNDLALLKHSYPNQRVLKFADTALKKGETVYALGNPQDYGTSLVKGPNNGMVEHSFDDQILFSGSLNPGMSGGPALNDAGEIVGVNVATAGSQLSFLVPATKAKLLVSANRELPRHGYQDELTRQIKVWQRARVQSLLDQEWPPEPFAGESLFGEIRKDFQCWGYTNDDDKKRHVATASKSCRAGNSLYLDSNLEAGELYFSFAHSKSLSLTATQFAKGIEPWMSANNQSNYEQSTNYQCHVDFLQDNASNQSYTRATTCVRAFKKLKGLFDSLLMVERIENRQKLVTHLSLSALERDQIQQFNRKFLEASL